MGHRGPVFRDPARRRTGHLPDQGWDRVLVWAFRDRHRGHPPTTASALKITVDTGYLGRGLSYRMLAALRNPTGPRLTVTPTAWSTFVTYARNN